MLLPSKFFWSILVTILFIICLPIGVVLGALFAAGEMVYSICQKYHNGMNDIWNCTGEEVSEDETEAL